MGTALIGGLLTIVGAVLGAGVTTWTTRRTADRSEHRAWYEARRTEFRGAVSQSATAIRSYRELMLVSWLAKQRALKAGSPSTGPEADAVWTATTDAARQHDVATEALILLELSTDDDELEELARMALEKVSAMWDATTEEELNVLIEDAQRALKLVVQRAKNVQPGSSVLGSVGQHAQEVSVLVPPVRRADPVVAVGDDQGPLPAAAD